jgi:hypothetical protein
MTTLQHLAGVCQHCGRDYSADPEGLPQSCIDECPSNTHPALEAICTETNTVPNDWSEVDGPETGVGVERYFQHAVDERTYYTCDDQGTISISLTNTED